MPQGRKITRQAGAVSVAARGEALGQRGSVVWLTGLSGAGKSTIAFALEEALATRGFHAFVLDGDNLRGGLCADLGFGPADRQENIRRVGQVATLFADAGLIAICAFISPYAAGREAVRIAAGPERFIEVFLDTPLAVCEQRDPKGLYARARRGELSDFTGIDAPYEKPAAPTLSLQTDTLDVASCVSALVAELVSIGAIASADE